MRAGSLRGDATARTASRRMIGFHEEAVMKRHPITIAILALALGVWIAACTSGGGSGSYEPPPSAPSRCAKRHPHPYAHSRIRRWRIPHRPVDRHPGPAIPAAAAGRSAPISCKTARQSTARPRSRSMGTPISGTLDGTTCNSTGPGTIDVGFAQNGGGYSSQFHGTYTQNTITGTYTDSNGDTGTFTLTCVQ